VKIFLDFTVVIAAAVVGVVTLVGVLIAATVDAAVVTAPSRGAKKDAVASFVRCLPLHLSLSASGAAKCCFNFCSSVAAIDFDFVCCSNTTDYCLYGYWFHLCTLGSSLSDQKLGHQIGFAVLSSSLCGCSVTAVDVSSLAKSNASGFAGPWLHLWLPPQLPPLAAAAAAAAAASCMD